MTVQTAMTAARPSYKELHPQLRAELQQAGAVATLLDLEGEELLRRRRARTSRMPVEGQEAFERWCKVWEPQQHGGFCGPASAVAALHFLGLDSARAWTQQRIYEEVICPKQLFTRGLSFANGVIMLKILSDRFQVFEHSSFDEVQIAQQLRKDLEDAFEKGEEMCILVNYIRLGGGHWSPLAGWSNGHVLILDTNQQRLPPHWVSLETLVESLCRYNRATERPRGYVVLRCAETERHQKRQRSPKVDGG
eukprot:g9447.t1